MKQTKIVMNEAQFACVANLIRARDPARSAAYSVLVQGESNREVMKATGISPASLSNTLARYRKSLTEIAEGFELKRCVLRVEDGVEVICFK